MAEQQKERAVKVLLVDDDVSLLHVSLSILKDMDKNLVVESATNVEEALQKLSTATIDVVISDYEMPQKNGLDFLQEVRSKYGKIPFILFTGKGREEIAIEALNLGADRYLNKNGNPEAVYRELTKSIQVLNERSIAQKMLLESEQRLKRFIENAPDAVFVCDQYGRFLDANKEFEILSVYSKEELLGRDIFELGLVCGPAVAEMKKFLEEIEIDQKYRPSEVEIKRKNGSTAIAEVSIFSVKRDAAVEILGIARDVTQRKNAESEMIQKYEALERVTKSLDSALAIIGRDYRVVWANSILQQRMVDRNKHCYQLFNNLDTVCPNCGVKKVFEENASIDIHEYDFIGSNGKPVCVELRVTPLKGKNGEVIGAIELGVPITERKKAEGELASVNEKLRVVGKLTRHDVRNKLSTISSNIYLLRKRYGNNPEIIKYLDSIDSAVALSNRLFDFTALYEKIGVQEQTDIDVKKCFDDAIALFPHMNSIQVINDSQGLSVIADSLLRQIFYNLVDNSLKHGKTVTQIRLHYKRELDHVKLYYEDNGVGIPHENKQKIFLEHFTTNGGTGLGMPAIRKIMEVYNWSIEETGVPNVGARFEIKIDTATAK